MAIRAHIFAVVLACLAATATAALTHPPARSFSEGSEPMPSSTSVPKRSSELGLGCEQHADCPDSFCLNSLPFHQPYSCFHDHAPLCANADLRCSHVGSIHQVACLSDAHCPAGSSCVVNTDKTSSGPSMVCHTGVAPVCGCDCIQPWGGPTCDEYLTAAQVAAVNAEMVKRTKPSNHNHHHHRRHYSKNFTRTMAQQEKAHLQYVKEVFNAFSGFLGLGFNALTGTVELPAPAIALDYYDSKNRFDGRRMPATAVFTNVRGNLSEPAPAACFSQQTWNVQSWSEIWQDTQQAESQFTTQQVKLGGLWDVFDDVSTAEALFKSDQALGVSRMSITFYEMAFASLSNHSASQWLDTVAQTLPLNMTLANETQAYADVVNYWGTHYVVGSKLGAMLTMQVNYNWWLNDVPSFIGGGPFTNQDLINYINGDFDLAKGYTAQGVELTPATRAQLEADIPALYKAHRVVQPVTCLGSNPELCRSNITAFMADINPNSVAPLAVEARPLSVLFSTPEVSTNMATYVKRLISSYNAEVDEKNACPTCAPGSSCAAGSDHCNCDSNSYGRSCKLCRPQYSGSSCNSFTCNGCNTAGGTCVAPNQCQCNTCYAGTDCTTYTCACFDASSRVLRSDNVSVPLSQVKLGDSVLAMDPSTSQLVFSPVYYSRVSNQGAAAKAVVVELHVEGMEETLKLTEEHLVYISKRWTPSASLASAQEVMASTVVAGDYVWVLPSASSSSLVLRLVTAVESHDEALELASIYTLAGPVVVDGIVASSYEWNSAWQKLESLEARLMFQYFPSIAQSEWYMNHVNWWDDHVTEPMQPVLRVLSSAVSAIAAAASSTVSSLWAAIQPAAASM